MAQEYARGVFLHQDTYADIVRFGRWMWRIRILVPFQYETLGPFEWTIVTVFGRQRAARIARRMIDRHIRNHTNRFGERFEIHRGDA